MCENLPHQSVGGNMQQCKTEDFSCRPVCGKNTHKFKGVKMAIKQHHYTIFH